ncbi:MAG TPA: HD domain-containing protein [Natronincola sp.]|nr:HD domain-containing protein [Natronincola sp.]
MEEVAERLERQIRFIIEIDQMKHILRRNLVIDGSRRENDAEHSWHLALMAMILSEYAEEEVELSKVIKMVLMHDLVEVYAGDTFCYDAEGGKDKEEREKLAAEKLFSILPCDQGEELKLLWFEFEERKTPEAKFAACLDRLQPLLNNYHTNGGTWVEYDVSSEQVYKRMEAIEDASTVLGEYARKIIEDSIRKGILKR